uniref:Uncharacterized protein n=1 Tax=Glossina brevipalpis TaxID=37001 RepID=A0A1A9X0E2_9MUSC
MTAVNLSQPSPIASEATLAAGNLTFTLQLLLPSSLPHWLLHSREQLQPSEQLHRPRQLHPFDQLSQEDKSQLPEEEELQLPQDMKSRYIRCCNNCNCCTDCQIVEDNNYLYHFTGSISQFNNDFDEWERHLIHYVPCTINILHCYRCECFTWIITQREKDHINSEAVQICLRIRVKNKVNIIQIKEKDMFSALIYTGYILLGMTLLNVDLIYPSSLP